MKQCVVLTVPTFDCSKETGPYCSCVKPRSWFANRLLYATLVLSIWYETSKDLFSQKPFFYYESFGVDYLWRKPLNGGSVSHKSRTVANTITYQAHIRKTNWAACIPLSFFAKFNILARVNSLAYELSILAKITKSCWIQLSTLADYILLWSIIQAKVSAS